ncbi:glucose/arabinose dehydrogenase [Mobilisporobacter senegalensis]|uniref:Glucose/arabinose dehydrogenase n=1 Tax=Mobilisporobacter senegalensis TaxID=1329262 RepID=A0A3N1XVG1_9FIRM|nr:PQQ-dependent sugar dehydrogenase [Mobilisporobacter senegalensis]ROR30599.1 glucose/arabinose dehydrogenase [Mobilisporobacter senegalensis]
MINNVRTSQITSDEIPYDVEIIAQNFNIPWAIAISDEGRIYVTERTGAIYIIDHGRILPEPLIVLEAPFVSVGEGGLMGIVLDPEFTQNHYIYVMHTYEEGNRIYNRVIRLVEEDNRAYIDEIIIDRIPGGRVHDGGRIKIGPDEKLYITTGDGGDSSLSQDLSSTAGKILRISLDGSIPADNPFPGSPIYSYGHRNPEGIDWNLNNILYASDHGASAHDEINMIIEGGNYGWPLVQGDEDLEELDLQRPLIHSGPVTWAPSGIAFVTQGPWEGKLLVANLRGEQLLVMTLNEDGTRIENVEPIFTNQFGRLREVIEAKDGSIYITTSNMDGRGNPDRTDDKIIRLEPRF